MATDEAASNACTPMVVVANRAGGAEPFAEAITYQQRFDHYDMIW